jgi:hypothetical protein
MSMDIGLAWLCAELKRLRFCHCSRELLRIVFEN